MTRRRAHARTRDRRTGRKAAIALLLLLGGLPAQGLRVHTDALDPPAVRSLREAAQWALTRAESALDRPVSQPVDLTFVRHASGLPAEVQSSFQPWTVGLALTHRYQVFVVRDRLQPDPPDDLRTVLVHEFVHVVLGDLELQLSGGQRQLPRWLHEGLAQDIAGSVSLAGNDAIVWFRAKTDRLIPWSELTTSFPADRDEARAAYAQAASFVAYLRRELGLATVLATAQDYLSGGAESLDVALHHLRWGDSYAARSGEWIRELKEGLFALSWLRENCFSFLIFLAIPLLAVVLYKRHQRERRAGDRLEAWERMQDEQEDDPEGDA